MMNDDRDELDRLIDAALSGYSAAEPREGLEQRVLRRVRAAGPVQRRSWVFPFALAVPALAGLMLAAIAVRTWWPAVKPPRPAAPAVVALQRPAVAAQGDRATPPRIMVLQRRSVRPRPLPKHERFPAPAPLTPEERALVAWARSAPDQARQAFADLRARAEEPVVVAPIQIPPLRGDGAQ